MACPYKKITNTQGGEIPPCVFESDIVIFCNKGLQPLVDFLHLHTILLCLLFL
jgi:hypothetical protein